MHDWEAYAFAHCMPAESQEVVTTKLETVATPLVTMPTLPRCSRDSVHDHDTPGAEMVTRELVSMDTVKEKALDDGYATVVLPQQ